MSDAIKHECGVALLRLRRDNEYFRRKYGCAAYGRNKLALMLEKQHNRGQDGAGIASVRLSPEPGEPAYTVEKSAAGSPLADLLGKVAARGGEFDGEVLLGHVRYATYGRGELSDCHPFVHDSGCLRRILLMAGNFNLTSTEKLFAKYMKLGHHPSGRSDGYLILQMVAHYIERELDVNPDSENWGRILRQAAEDFDGAFVLCGVTGGGSVFALRDSHGIRPGYFYFNDEVFAMASERPAIQAAFDCSTNEVMELPPGKAVTVSGDGKFSIQDCLDPQPRRSCVFERIYFSRPNDADIHRERRNLGRALTGDVLKASGGDLEHTFFSYIPNSAQVGFHGLLDVLQKRAAAEGRTVRFGQIAVKDAKFRTFIADADARRELYMHVYDVTYGLVHPGEDTLVVLDDSIVRGNTVRDAILPVLDRLGPRKIVVASTAPQIRFPDCYGIDMSTARELVAFRAAVSLLRKKGEYGYVEECAARAAKELSAGDSGTQHNCLADVYAPLEYGELTREIGLLLTPPGLRAGFEVVFQSVEALRQCCPDHTGDWYFTGDYPTPGGVAVANRALVNYIENKTERTY